MDVEVEGNIEAQIELSTINDAISLEYNDTLLLLFSPEESDLIEFYEGEGEYIRENVTVHIIDSDSKQLFLLVSM